MSDANINAAIVLLVRAGFTVTAPVRPVTMPATQSQAPKATPTPTPTPAQTHEVHKCSTCGATGHNSRTCTKGKAATTTSAPATTTQAAPAAPAALSDLSFDLGDFFGPSTSSAPKAPSRTVAKPATAPATAPKAQPAAPAATPAAMPAGVASDADLDALLGDLDNLDSLIA